MLVHEWIAVVLLRVIYFWYSWCNSSVSIYYIDLKLLFAVIRHFKKGTCFFHFRALNNIFDSDDVSTVHTFVFQRVDSVNHDYVIIAVIISVRCATGMTQW
jgi:hypothetical protein